MQEKGINQLECEIMMLLNDCIKHRMGVRKTKDMFSRYKDKFILKKEVKRQY